MLMCEQMILTVFVIALALGAETEFQRRIVEFRPAGMVIIIERIIQEVFFQVLQFRLQIFALGRRRFADTLIFNLIQADIKHQQPGNLWFPGLKEKNLFFRIRELVFGNGGFQQNKRHLYDINNLLNLI